MIHTLTACTSHCLEINTWLISRYLAYRPGSTQYLHKAREHLWSAGAIYLVTLHYVTFNRGHYFLPVSKIEQQAY